mmetsp:Transcript_31795/g.46890  ORF Transcript_31795/g.46890 Transcript_31795/m.46890 type:complete len:415 (-) Transcript_31795:931-2175(-)
MMETPQTRILPHRSNSERVVNEQEKRMNTEINQLLIDIRRIGPTHPEPSPRVLFGELFDDDEVQQHYEALVGTLKSAKKRGVINFKGQMLLKGMHDKVVISIVEGGTPVDKGSTNLGSKGASVRLPTPNVMTPTPYSECTDRPTPMSLDQQPLSLRSVSPKKFIFASPAVEGTHKKGEIGNSRSFQPSSNGKLACNDRDLKDISFEVISPAPRVIRSSQKGLPPPSPWSVVGKQAKTEKNTKKKLSLSKTCSSPQFGDGDKEIDENRQYKNSPNVDVEKTKYNKVTPINRSSTPKTTPLQMVTPTTGLRRSLSTPAPRMPSSSRSQSSRNHCDEAASRVEDEVHRIVVDIRRVGDNPGEPSVTFGELFDDEEVQNTYEALVGTLRSAKRQGIIKFKGQMLLKGMHDNVVISVVE